MYCVYKYINPETDECLYVGKTSNLHRRHVQHLGRSESSWCNIRLRLEYLEVPDKENMNMYEIYLINTLHPKYNKVLKNSMDTRFIKFDYDSIWKEYSKYDFRNNMKKSCEKLLEVSVEDSSLELFKRLIESKCIKELLYDDFRFMIHFTDIDKSLIDDRLSLRAVGIKYDGIRYDYCGGLINIKIDYTDNSNIDIVFYMKLDILKKIVDEALLSDEDILVMDESVGEFLSLANVNYKWNQLPSVVSKLINK